MTTPTDGPRFRRDDRPGANPYAETFDRAGRSGRRFVIAAIAIGLVTWGGLYLSFVRWRAAYRDRAAFARAEVVPTLDPLAKLVPPGVLPDAWSRSVAETRALIDDLVGSNVMSRAQMVELRDDLARRVASARPETAPLVLIGVWSDLIDRAGPALDFNRTPVPLLIVPAVPVAPMAGLRPPDVDPDAWSRALDATRLMLVAAAASGDLDGEAIQDLSNAVAVRVSDATPKTARGVLTEIWDDAARRSPSVKERPRPEILY